MKLLAVKREHQPPCLGATISISSASASLVAARDEAATKLPFTAVAIFALGEAEPRAKLVERRSRRWRRPHR